MKHSLPRASLTHVPATLRSPARIPPPLVASFPHSRQTTADAVAVGVCATDGACKVLGIQCLQTLRVRAAAKVGSEKFDQEKREFKIFDIAKGPMDGEGTCNMDYA
jgi:hypothetical protein